MLLSVDRSVFAVSVGKSAVRPVLLGDASCRPSIKVPYSHHRTVGESVGRCVVRQQTHCYCRSVGPVFVSERVVCSVLSVGASCRSVGKGAVPSVGRWVIHRKTYCWRVIISRSARGRGGEGAWRGGRDKGREVERADRGRVEHTLVILLSVVDRVIGLYADRRYTCRSVGFAVGSVGTFVCWQNCRSVDTIGHEVHYPSVKVPLARYCRSVGALSGGTRADRSLLSDGRSVNQSVRWYVGRRVCHLSANARLAGCRLSVGFYPSMRMPFS